jgi:hypothetical protein
MFIAIMFILSASILAVSIVIFKRTDASFVLPSNNAPATGESLSLCSVRDAIDPFSLAPSDLDDDSLFD